MPFAGYKDFDDCVAKNQDKDDPEAYCGYIKHQVEDALYEQGTPKTDAERAKAHFNISDEEWAELSDEEKQAYIAQLPPLGSKREELRHRDFSRIYDEFVNYYKNTAKGESEYYAWLKALRLDETKEYGQAQESFQWAKNMLNYLREDDRYKYYKVFVGFPIKSMNGNVYNERDLVAAALTLKGLHPNLNHKDEWHFTPDSRWGEITTEDARYEDGAIEAIVKVSKSAVCPICDGKPMTELIDSKRIVNVSLQGGCAAQNYTGVCDGFQFDDKGFSLLTSDVLPGIPMARIFPLEHIMVEALHSSTAPTIKVKLKMKKGKRQRIKIKPKIKEEGMTADEIKAKIKDLIDKQNELDAKFAKDSDEYWAEYDLLTIEINALETALAAIVPIDVLPLETRQQIEQLRRFAKLKEETDPAKMGQTRPLATGRDGSPADSSVYREAGQGTSGGPSGATFRGTLRNVSQQTEVARGTDPATSKPEGIWKTTITEPENTLPHESVGDPLTVKPSDQPQLISPSTPMPEPDSHVGPSTTPSPSPDLTTSELPSSEQPTPEPPMQPTAPSTMTPKPPHDCGPGKHWSDVDGGCVPDEASLVDTSPASGTTAPLGEQEVPKPPCPDGWHQVGDDCVKDTAEQEEPCPDGYHRNEEGDCVPDEPLEERVKRIKAETRELIALGESERLRNTMRNLETVWISKYSKLDRMLQKSEAYNRQQDKILKQQRDMIRKEQMRCEDLRVEMRDLKNQFSDAVSQSNKYARLIEDLKIDNADLHKKYHGAIKTNLELTKKYDLANEEYLELAKMKDVAEDKLKKARTNAKKTLKLRI